MLVASSGFPFTAEIMWSVDDEIDGFAQKIATPLHLLRLTGLNQNWQGWAWAATANAPKMIPGSSLGTMFINTSPSTK